MGGACSSSRSFKEDYQLVNQIDHPTLGHIQILRSIQKQSAYQRQIGAKWMVFDSLKQQEQYREIIKNAQSYENIPTLLKVLTCSNGNDESNNQNRTRAIRITGNCSEVYKTKVYFQYHKKTLRQVISEKKDSLAKVSAGISALLPSKIKFCDYQAIDQLSNSERKLINMHYQEVQILRMIDHIVGGLYFLNHLGHQHEAVCPENIFVDDEGKFVLIDAQVLGLKTNYDLALSTFSNKSLFSKNSERERQAVHYLSPQLLSHLKGRHSQHKQNSEKIEIFSVGLIGLEMCLLGTDVFKRIYDEKNFKINKNELNTLLILTRDRYSVELVDLLRIMLEYDPNKRVTYSTLIDLLNPLLTSNLQRIQKLYNQENMEMSISGQQDEAFSNQLLKKLSDLQNRYQRILNNRVMAEERRTLDQEQIKKDEKRILKELRSVGAGNQGNGKSKREVRGSELYEIYLNEYQNLKNNRIK